MSEKELVNISDDKAIIVWNKVLTGALKLPGTRINRNAFLTKELEQKLFEIQRNI